MGVRALCDAITRAASAAGRGREPRSGGGLRTYTVEMGLLHDGFNAILR